MKKAIDEIIEFFEKHNIEFSIVYYPDISGNPEIYMEFENEKGEFDELEFWEDRVKWFTIKRAVERKNEKNG